MNEIGAALRELGEANAQLVALLALLALITMRWSDQMPRHGWARRWAWVAYWCAIVNGVILVAGRVLQWL